MKASDTLQDGSYYPNERQTLESALRNPFGSPLELFGFITFDGVMYDP